MLWLAGLIGLVGASAASVVISPIDTAQPEDDEEDDVYTRDEGLGDLFDQIDTIRDEDVSQRATLLGDLDALGDRQPDWFLNDPDVGGRVDSEFGHPFYDEASGDAGPDDAHDWAWQGEAQPPLPGSGVQLGDWILQGAPAEVMDYDAGRDSLVLVWDDLESPGREPDVRVETDPFDDEIMHVVMNDTSVAEVYGDPELNSGDITMIPLSSALIVGLEPA